MLNVSCASAPPKTTQSTPTISLAHAGTTSPLPPDPPCDQALTKEFTRLTLEGDRVVALEPEKALSFYEQAVALAPDEARIFYRIGQIHQKKDAWDKAAEAFGRATNIAPTYANYWFWYGYSLERIAKRNHRGWEEARDALEKCITIDENYSECHHRLGWVHMYLDDERKTLEYFTKAIRISPTKIEYYPPLADLYLNLGFVEEAEVVLNEAVKFGNPGDKRLFWVQVLLSEVKHEHGDESGRVAALEAAKAVAGTEGIESIQILFMLGSTYATIQPPRTAEAIANLKGFWVRICKRTVAANYAVECSQTRALLTKLGATVP